MRLKTLAVALAITLLSAPLWAQIGTSNLSWVDAATNENGSVLNIIETRIYRSNIASVGPYNQVDSVPGGTMSYTDSGLFNGQYFYYVTHVNDFLLESTASNWDDVVIALGGANDPPLPNPPTNLVAQ